MLLPLLEGETQGQAASLVDTLWGVVTDRASTASKASKASSATFVPLAEGPMLLDSINKIQLHPHDEARLKQGSRTITEMSETFTVSSEKDLQRLEKLEKKQKEKQLSAYVEHRRQMEETMAGARSVRVFSGGLVSAGIGWYRLVLIDDLCSLDHRAPLGSMFRRLHLMVVIERAQPKHLEQIRPSAPIP
jgi:DNA-binding Lrp family transcriptional regulator